MEFPPTLTSVERAVLHEQALLMGMKSRSKGSKKVPESRFITVSKSGAARGGQKKQGEKKERLQGAIQVTIGKHSLGSLHRHLERFPPSPADSATGPSPAAATGPWDPAANERRSGPGSRASQLPQPTVEKLHGAWRAWAATEAGAAMQARRAALPMAAHREEVLAAVASNRVVLIRGETGCGKTTQVPQYLLEASWEAGRAAHVLCTQPRRISAISCAERIAQERGETVGGNVGYNIRLETRGRADTSIMFATNGVLLRLLSRGHDALAHVTHLVMDEIHERDRFADIALILVREVLPRHPALRVVLMSATLHAELFSAYFDGCPIISVPGFTHPVEDFYLEDVLRLTGTHVPDPFELKKLRPSKPPPPPADRAARVCAALESAFMLDTDAAFDELMHAVGLGRYDADDEGDLAKALVNVQHPATGASPLMVCAGRNRGKMVQHLLCFGADAGLTSRDGSAAADWARMFGHGALAEELTGVAEEQRREREVAAAVSETATAVALYQSVHDPEEVDVPLILDLLRYICGRDAGADESRRQLGSVLIFLPGWAEISDAKAALLADAQFGDARRFQLLSLHSMVSPADQRRAFARPPPGVRKLILSTNVAETSVTIDDVVVVINSGRLKEKGYDPFTGVSTLQSAWTSKANERQRRGRAGRCQPGIAFHLYTRARAEALPEFQVPELRRSPLEDIALQAKLMIDPRTDRPFLIADLLERAIDPPVPKAVAAARDLLRGIGALDADENLTELGRHLSALPVPPALGKLVLHGILLDCLDPLLTLACFRAYRDPWTIPPDPRAKAEASAARLRLAADRRAASDHLASLRAFEAWQAAERRPGGGARWAASNYASHSTLRMVQGMREQVIGELRRLGFITTLAAASQHAGNLSLVRAALAAGLYPMIGQVRPSRDGKQLSLFTAEDEKVLIRSGSVVGPWLAQRKKKKGAVFAAILDELTRGDSGGLCVNGCTLVPPLSVLLVCAKATCIDVEESEDEDSDGMDGVETRDTPPAGTAVLVDDWLALEVPPGTREGLLTLRSRLTQAFYASIENSGVPLSPLLADAVATVKGLFAMEGGEEFNEPPQEGFVQNPPQNTRWGAPPSKSVFVPIPSTYTAPRGDARRPPPGKKPRRNGAGDAERDAQSSAKPAKEKRKSGGRGKKQKTPVVDGKSAS